jgi:RNA polymerase sigma factor (sigma-70 family)
MLILAGSLEPGLWLSPPVSTMSSTIDSIGTWISPPPPPEHSTPTVQQPTASPITAAPTGRVVENMPLVYHVATALFKKMGPVRQFGFEDTVQEGMLGLIQADKQFDPAKAEGTGATFGTYAYVAIRRRILERANHYLRDRLETRAFSLPGPGEGHSDLPSDIEERLLDHSHLHVQEEMEAEERRQQLHKALRRLPLPQRTLVQKYFGIGRKRQNLREIGVKLGVCRERVRQRLAIALAALREQLADDYAAVG